MKSSFVLLSSLVSIIHGSLGTDVQPYVRDHHYRETNLFPTRHPDHDATNITHLKPSESLELHYHDPAVPWHTPRSFATVYIAGFNAPAVNLDNSDHVTSVSCDKDSMVILFANDMAWKTAVTEWSVSSELVMITFRDECGEGTVSGQRSFHMVSDMKPNEAKHQISFAMSTVPLEDVVHPQKDITIDVAAYQLDPNRPIGHLSRRTVVTDPYNNAWDDDLDFEEGTISSSDSSALAALVPGTVNSRVAKRSTAGCIAGALFPISLPFLCPEIRKPLVDAVFPKSTADKINGFFDNVANVATKIFDGFKTAGKALAQFLSSNGYNPAGTAVFDTNVSHPMIYTKEFGSAYKVYSLDKSKKVKTHSGNATATAKLDVYCVGCRVNGFIQYEAHFKYTLEKFKFSDARILIKDGSLQFEVGIGLALDVNIGGNLAEYPLPTVPLSPLTIPGILVVGPSLAPVIGADWKLGATGTLVGRVGFGWKDMNLFIDFLDIKKSSAKKWTPLETHPTFGVQITGKATLTPYFATQLNIGVDILSGKLIVAAGLETKASLPLSAEVQVSSKTGIGSDGCAGATASLDLAVALAFILRAGKLKGEPFGNKEFHPLDGILPLKKCVPLPFAKSINALVAPPPLPATAMSPLTAAVNGSASGITLRKITSSSTPKGTFQIIWQPGYKNLYIVPTNSPVLANSDALGSMLFLTKKGEKALGATGTADGRFFHIYSDIVNNPDKVKASRIRLGSKDSIPKGSILVGLRADRLENGKSVMKAVTTNSDLSKNTGVYYLVGCVYKDSRKLTKVFVVGSDIQGGIDYLMKQKLVPAEQAAGMNPPPLKDAEFDSCFLFPFDFDPAT